ncbi:diguanylate cyclase [Salinimonas sp. HHU 13199]|uniref:diguanylate cyclase n=1 Tax=Salinimonas profundi TaxID=2729140 RepID=A0ABR8LLE8_9ALTE|nr:GGDEF domain-containing protein [Salinimonas profundi]MBD3586373.1 diguanylate cyclase [Salinimonas profundi]
MYLRLITFTLLVLTCLTVFADTLNDYEAKRREILQQAPENRLEALDDHPFDTSTPLGKYFYLSSFLYIENDPAFYALTESELETLRADYPQYFYEREVLMVWLSDLPDEERFEKFRSIQTIARKNNWPRIEGWATSLLVTSLQAAELHFNAILEMNNYTPKAPHTDKDGMFYDYPLMGVFLDISISLYYLDDYKGSLEFCGKYKQYLPENTSTQFYGLSCEISSLIALERYDEVQSKLKKMNQIAEQSGLTEYKVQLSLSSAFFYRAIERPDLTYHYAKDALDIFQRDGKSLNPTVYNIYVLLTVSQIDLENIERAEFYLKKLQELPLTTQIEGPGTQVDSLVAQANIYELKGQYEKALPYYKEAFEALYLNEASTFSFTQLKSINSSLNSRELALTKKQLQEETRYSTIVTLVAGVSIVIALVTSALVWRLTRRKRDLERFSRLDSLTRVYNRWFALDAIRKHLNGMKRLDDKVCVALIDIDHFKRINNLFGHQVGDAVLSHFARLCKYQFRSEDVFGRYGGEAFILMLNGAAQTDAAEKLQGLRDVLSHQDLTKLGADGALEFSSGVVEVSEKADITQVLTQCDKLLYAAKRNGRNQDICTPFRPAEQDDIL